MKIITVGAGGVGAYFGGRLALAGEDVGFLCRGRHLQAIRERGLRVESINGDFTIHPTTASDDPAELGVADIVLLCVKGFQVMEVARRLETCIGPNTLVIPLQNSIVPIRDIPGILGAEHVAGGMCRIVSFQDAPGLVKHIAAEPDITFGRLDGRSDARLEALRAAFERARVSVRISSDIRVTLWEKLVFVATMGGLGAVTRAPIGVVRQLPETRAMFERGMREVKAVAEGSGVRVAGDVVERYMGYIDTLEPASTASMQRDIMEEKVSELLECNGPIVSLAQELGIPAPLHEFIYSSLLPGELRRRGRLAFPGDASTGAADEAS